MNLYTDAVLAGLFVDGALLALVVVRGRRPWLKATFAAFALTLLVNGVAYVGTAEGLLASGWLAAVLWTAVLSYALLAILVLSLIHGETVPRRRPAILLLLAFVPVAMLFVPDAAAGLANLYEPGVLGGLVTVALGIALADPLYERLTSALFATDAFWLSAAVVVAALGGPIYTYEFGALGDAPAPGANLLAPAALGILTFILFRADPFRHDAPRARRWDGESSLPRGAVVVFEEMRPAYALEAAAREAARGRPVLVIDRGPGPRGIPDVPFAAVPPSRQAALRTLATASEFLARAPGGLVVLSATADLVPLSGWVRTQETVRRLGQVAADTGSTVLVSTGRLSPEEREELGAADATSWRLPDAAKELEAILAASFGTGAGRLLDSFARTLGRRRDELTPADVAPLADFLGRAIGELSRPAADAPTAASLQSQAQTAVAALRTFAARAPADLARGAWPSESSRSRDDLLVTAADYWKGKEMDELLAVADDLSDRVPLSERARGVFVAQLGQAGDGLFATELAKLGKRPEELRPDDVARMADRAAVDLAAMAEIVDVPQERARLRGRVEAIRRELEAIAGERS